MPSLSRHTDCPSHTDFAVIDPEIISAIRIGAHPCFVANGSPISPVIRQWYQNALLAPQALWKVALHVYHPLDLENRSRSPRTISPFCSVTR
jgi:hypothetical protein